MVKNLPASAGDIRVMGSVPRLERSPGGGHGNPLQYSCLENPMDRGAWRTAIHGVTKSQTRLKLLSTCHAVSEGGGLCEKNRMDDGCRRSCMVGLANRNMAHFPWSTQSSQDVHLDF